MLIVSQHWWRRHHLHPLTELPWIEHLKLRNVYESSKSSDSKPELISLVPIGRCTISDTGSTQGRDGVLRYMACWTDVLRWRHRVAMAARSRWRHRVAMAAQGPGAAHRSVSMGPIQKLYRWKALVKANSIGYMPVPNTRLILYLYYYTIGGLLLLCYWAF